MSFTKSTSLFLLGTIVAALSITTQASAFEIVTPKTNSDNVVIETNTTINDTVFGTGNDIDVRGNIDNDAFLAGKNVAIHQRVGNNVFAAGTTVRISGQVTGDVFIAGQSVYIDDTATINGDIVAAGNNVQINGLVHGTVRAYGTDVTIGGKIGKDVIIGASNATLSSTAVITGDLTGSVQQPIKQLAGSVVQGKLNLERTNNPGPMQGPSRSGADTIMVLLGTFLFIMVGSIITSIIAPNLTERVRTQSQKQPLNSGLVGLLAILVSFPLFFILLAMIITIPVALFELSAFVAIMILGHVFSMLWIGDRVGIMISKKYWSVIGALAVGTTVYLLIGMIPLIGMLLGFIAFTVGVGALLIDLWRHYLHGTK
jgi:hypothetical protein